MARRKQLPGLKDHKAQHMTLSLALLVFTDCRKGQAGLKKQVSLGITI